MKMKIILWTKYLVFGCFWNDNDVVQVKTWPGTCSEGVRGVEENPDGGRERRERDGECVLEIKRKGETTSKHNSIRHRRYSFGWNKIVSTVVIQMVSPPYTWDTQCLIIRLLHAFKLFYFIHCKHSKTLWNQWKRTFEQPWPRVVAFQLVFCTKRQWCFGIIRTRLSLLQHPLSPHGAIIVQHCRWIHHRLFTFRTAWWLKQRCHTVNNKTALPLFVLSPLLKWARKHHHVFIYTGTIHAIYICYVCVRSR